MKRTLLPLILVALSACTTVNTASQPYRPRGGDAMTTIQGQLSGNRFYGSSPELAILIGPQEAARGALGSFGRGAINGMHNGKPVTADCSSNASGWSWTYTIKCLVMIDGEHAATLNLNPLE